MIRHSEAPSVNHKKSVSTYAGTRIEMCKIYAEISEIQFL